MSFNLDFVSQRESLGCPFDPQPSVRGPFDTGFNIQQDDDSTLSTIGSSQLEVPTEFQSTNNDSQVALAEPAPAISMPFDYSWINWATQGVDGYTLMDQHKRTSAWWWQYGSPLQGPWRNPRTGTVETKLYFLCKTCHLTAPDKHKPFKVAGGSQHVLQHFRTVHYSTYMSNVNDQVKQPGRTRAIELFQTSNPEQQAVYNRLIEATDPDMLRKDILRWIVYDNVPFKKVTSPHFRQLIRATHPLLNDSVVPNERTISRWIVQEFRCHKQEIKESMKTAISRIHLAFDLWTSSRRKAINGITANWVDRKGRCRTALIALTEMGDRHDGVSIATSVQPVINDYDFGCKLGFLVLDNAASNDTCVQELGRLYDFDPTERRLRCVGHILNLIAQELLYGNDYDKFQGAVESVSDLQEQARLWRAQGPIGMIAQIVRWVNKSPGRVKRFEEAQERVWTRDNPSITQKCVLLRLYMDNSTRWNSTRDMIYRAYQLRTALDEFLDFEQSRHIRNLRTLPALSQTSDDREARTTRLIFRHRMSSDEWAIVNEILEILEPLKAFTKRLEGRPSEETAHGIADVYPAIILILEQLETLKVQHASSQEGAAFWVAIENAWSKANDYYAKLDDTPVYTAVMLLDPRCKYQWLEKEWTYAEAQAQLNKVRRLWEREYRPRAASPLTVSTSPSSFSLSSPSSQERQPLSTFDHNRRPKKRAKLSAIDELLKENRRLPFARQVGDELTIYLNSELESDENLVPFQYWLREPVRTKYPSLSQLAIDIFSVPAMSSEAERVFSTAGFVLNSRRRRLKEGTSEALLCLNHWGNSNLVSVGNHHNSELRGSGNAALDGEISPGIDASDDMWDEGSSD